MRPLLNAIYAGALWLAALCVAAIAGLIGIQVATRIVDVALRLIGIARINFVILSLPEISGYLLAAATFLALAGTLKAGTHIRVALVLAALPETARRRLELLALGAATVASGWMAWRIALLAYDSWRFNEVSVGVLPLPLAVPQAVMALGGAVLTIALADELTIVARGGHPSFRNAEDALTLSKE